MDERTEKFNSFVEYDRINNKGRLVNACDELEFLLNNPQINSIFSQHYLTELLTYATSFSNFYSSYKNYTCLQDFPILKKQDLKDNWDRIAVKKYNADEVVVKYTSGSTVSAK